MRKPHAVANHASRTLLLLAFALQVHGKLRGAGEHVTKNITHGESAGYHADEKAQQDFASALLLHDGLLLHVVFIFSQTGEVLS